MDPELKLEATQQQFRSEQMGLDSGIDDGSFTALLELPPPQAVELLVKENYPALLPIFPSDAALVNRASMFSVFASANNDYSTASDKGFHEVASSSGNSMMRVDAVKQEPDDSDSNQSLKSCKRKEREKKVKESSKKNKKVAASETSEEGGDKLPYVHVRARRGQATDSHSLAERARREKINARMKLLQELVPGCNKISGTALVLDEIINHVQSLQRQVEFLSMRLAAVDPRIDFNIDALLPTNCGPATDDSYHQGMFAPSSLLQHQNQLNFGLHHQPAWVKEDSCNFFTPEASHLSYDSPPSTSATLHSNKPKKEL